MSTRDFASLARFFAPRSLALVGATDDLSKFGGRCLRQTIDFGFAGSLYPVNPRRDTIAGKRSYASIRDLPEAPDHVGIVLPAAAVVPVLEQCAERGVSFVTVFSSGYGESGTASGATAQQRIVDVARADGIRLMGPNCNGFVNFVDAVALTSTATLSGPRKPAGDLGVVSQSGGAGQVNVMWRAQQAGLGISYQVSCGNSADLDLVDFAAFMLESDATRVVLMLAESLRDGERFRALAARAEELGKAIVLVKVGRTESGSRAAASHTGAVTGSDAVADAAFEQLGVIRVDDCDELYETAMLLRRRRPPVGRRAAATSISGGNLVMVADLGASLGIEWPSYAEATIARLDAMLPGFGAAANPTDLTAAAIGREGAYEAAAAAILDDPSVDVLIPVLTMASTSDVRTVATLSAVSDKPIAILWSGGTTDDVTLTPEKLVAEGHAVYRDAMPCLKAVWRVMRHSEWRRRVGDRDIVRPSCIDVAAARELVADEHTTLSEHRSKRLLQAYAVPVTREGIARSAAEAVTLAASFDGPVALKVQSPDIPHKTEANALRLNVSGADAVRRSYDEVIAAASAYRPDVHIEGVLVQEMVTDAHEVFVGLSQDATFGPVVAIGLGGIYVEVLRDIVIRLAPLSHDATRRALSSLRAFPLLTGVRGRAPSDIEALVECIVRLSWLAVDLKDLVREVDVNPIAVLSAGRGVRVIDALVVPIAATSEQEFAA